MHLLQVLAERQPSTGHLDLVGLFLLGALQGLSGSIFLVKATQKATVRLRMPTLRNKVDLLFYNPSGWTQAEIRMGATSKEQMERQRVHQEIERKKAEDARIKAAEASERRQKARIDDARQSLEEFERQRMALEDSHARSWRSRDYLSPEEYWWASLERCLRQPSEWS